MEDRSNAPTLRIESLLSVSPEKLTDLGQIRRVIQVNGDSGALSGCLNILLYYQNYRVEDSGWLHAGWIKESLRRALTERPELSGRVRINGDRDGESWIEVVPNDSGVRLVQAQMDGVTLTEFLSSGNGPTRKLLSMDYRPQEILVLHLPSSSSSECVGRVETSVSHNLSS